MLVPQNPPSTCIGLKTHTWHLQACARQEGPQSDLDSCPNPPLPQACHPIRALFKCMKSCVQDDKICVQQAIDTCRCLPDARCINAQTWNKCCPAIHIFACIAARAQVSCHTMCNQIAAASIWLPQVRALPATCGSANSIHLITPRSSSQHSDRLEANVDGYVQQY